MLLGMIEKDPKSRLEHWALIRHSAVSWIEQSLNQGHTLGRALALASELDWGERRYSPRTLEGWLYEWRAQGFGALERQVARTKESVGRSAHRQSRRSSNCVCNIPALPSALWFATCRKVEFYSPALLVFPASIGCWCAKGWIGLWLSKNIRTEKLGQNSGRCSPYLVATRVI